MRILSTLAVLSIVGVASAASWSPCSVASSSYDCGSGYVCCDNGELLGLGFCLGTESSICQNGVIVGELPSTPATYDESSQSQVEAVTDQYEYDNQNYTNSSSSKHHGLKHQVKHFVSEHKEAFKIGGIVLAVYFLYKYLFYPKAGTVTQQACTCNCSAKVSQQAAPIVHYPVWTPPSVTGQQPLVQKEASQMI